MTGLFLHFLKLEVSIAKKYRVKLLFNLLHIVCLITLFYYISKTIGIIEVLDATYFPFVSTGLAFSYLTSGIINSSAGKITEWRDLGILEGLLLSPKSPWQLYLGAGLMDALLSTFKFIAILLFLSIGFLEIEAFRPGLLLFSTLTIIAISIGFSLIEACSILLWKRWGLLSSLSAITALFLSGVYFPVKILPPFFHWVAMMNPFFHGLLLLRTSLGIDSPDNQLISTSQSLTVLCLWSLGSLIGAFFYYRISEGYLHKTGSHLHV